VQCSASDAAGNTGHGSFHVTVTSSGSPPVITNVPADITAEATGPGGAQVTFTLPTATDAVDGNIPVTCAPAPGSTFPLGTTTVDCSATNSAGLTAHATFHVTVVDTTPPVFSGVPADISVTAPTGAGVGVTYTPPTAADLVDGPVTVSCSPSSGSVFPVGTTTVDCRATDAHGNTAHASFAVTVTVGTRTPPVISNVPGDITAEATGPGGAQVTFALPTATDAVDGTVPVTCVPAPGATFPLGSTTVDCSATNSGGLTAHASFRVTVVDTTAPVIAAHADVTAEATSAAGAAVSYTAPGATDAVDGTDLVVCTPGPGAAFPLGATTVNCSATDAHGNTGHSSFRVHVVDTTAPAIHGVPADITAEATAPAGAAVMYAAPTATDAVDGTDQVVCSPASGATFPLGTSTVTCAASDAAGNTSHASFYVTVADTTPPAIHVPADITVEATGPAGAAVPYAVTFTDAVGVTTSGCDPAPGSTFGLGVTTVHCSAADAAGNSSTGTFRVTVRDTTPPVIAGTPADVTAEATSPAGASVTFATPTATDLVDGIVAVSCTPGSGSTFPLGTTTVACTATDAHGNSAAASFHVKVQDTTPPVVTVPADRVVVSPTPIAVDYTASASDLVGGSITPTCSPASGATFPLGPTTVTCRATDAAGNTGSAAFTVTVAYDQASGTAPAGGTISTGHTPTPSDPLETSVTTPNAGTVTIVAEVAAGTPPAGFRFLGVQAVISAPPATAADPLLLEFALDPSLLPPGVDASSVVVWRDGAVVPPCTDPVAASPDPCVASRKPFPAPSGGGADLTIRSSHASVWSFGASVAAAPPVITVPSRVVVEISGPPHAVVTYAATAVDSLGHPVPVSCVPPSGSTFPLGDTTVTCSATDMQGNSSTASFVVTVVKKEKSKPVITVPRDLTVEATGPEGAVVAYTATVTDPYDDATLTCLPASGSTFPLGRTRVRCTAVDENGNRADPEEFDVRVVDTTPPVISGVPADLTVTSTKHDAVVTYPLPTADDLVAGAVRVHCDPHSGGRFHEGTTTVRCTAHDRSGNCALATFEVTVVVAPPPPPVHPPRHGKPGGR
jgi:hypothetical protein